MRPVRAVYDAWVTASRRQRAHRLRGRAAAVVLAGGSGTRVGADMNKAFLPLAGRSIASWGLNTLGSVEGVGLLVFVVRPEEDRKSTRLNSSHVANSYAVFCWKTKNKDEQTPTAVSRKQTR